MTPRALVGLLGLVLLAVACGRGATDGAAGAAVGDDDVVRELVALERAALDPYYGASDPDAYIGQFAEEGTYFDPWSSGKLVDGAIGRHLASFAGTIPLVGYDIVDPHADVHGDTAVFTFEVVTHDVDSDEVLTRWNATEIRVRAGDTWQMVHAHWSPLESEAVSEAEAAAPAGPEQESTEVPPTEEACDDYPLSEMLHGCD